MTFGDVAGKNFEVFTPSFERGNDSLKSRENLSNTEKIKSAMVFLESEEILKLKNSLREAKEAIDTGKLEAKTTMELSSIYFDIPNLSGDELNEFKKDLPNVFRVFAGSGAAAGELLAKEVRAIEEINIERDAALNIDEFNIAMNKKKEGRSGIEESIYGMIEYAKSAEIKWENNKEENKIHNV